MLFKNFLAGTAIAGVVCARTIAPRLSPGRVANPEDPVLVDEKGHYMRVCFGTNGTLYGAYTESTDDGEDILRLVETSDGAESWQQVGEAFRGDRKSHDINNAFPLQLESGRILYAYRNHERDPADGHYTFFRVSISYSDDGGSSFKYLSTVEERVPRPIGASGLWEPFLRVAKDGTVQCYYSSENNNGDQDGFMKFSSDEGATWSEWVSVSGGDRVSRDGMIGVAPIDNDGNLIAVFEETELGRFAVSYVLSHDDGYSWGERGRLYTPRDGGIAGAPQIYNVWGTLVAAFLTNEDVAGDPGYEYAEMKVITSNDGARTWSEATVVGSGAGWPGLFNIDSEHFLALYHKKGTGLVSHKWALVE
ncbi:hypothetical protein HJFPF1_12560 [Paramyrothecium foliicola]|nr:hypothetical protein HJFPF1_12560 [Paramyrothecium foliicola]